MNYSPLLRS